MKREVRVKCFASPTTDKAIHTEASLACAEYPLKIFVFPKSLLLNEIATAASADDLIASRVALALLSSFGHSAPVPCHHSSS